MVQTKCKLNNTELLLKLFHIQSKKIGNNKYNEETTEHEKWQSAGVSLSFCAGGQWGFSAGHI